MRLSLVLSAASVALSASPALAVTVSANSTYYFRGNCTDCAPANTPALATLVLQNYTAGMQLTDANFVSLTYNSNIASFNSSLAVTPQPLNHITGMLGATTGPYYVYFTQDYASGTPVGSDATVTSFQTNTDGSFFYRQDKAITPTFLSLALRNNDQGDNGAWSPVAFSTAAVPEPATWGLMVAGFGLAGAALRRQRRQVALPA